MIPLHLRKKLRTEKPKPKHFEVMPPIGSLMPGQRINVQVKFMPTEEVRGCFKLLAGNRPFPSSLVPLFQNESKCETFHMKMSFACSFIFVQISHFHKNIFALRFAMKQKHKGT